ncbi:putative FERM/acyl-CoA-binding protein superfamily [Plasmopara halstedii]
MIIGLIYCAVNKPSREELLSSSKPIHGSESWSVNKKDILNSRVISSMICQISSYELDRRIDEDSRPMPFAQLFHLTPDCLLSRKFLRGSKIGKPQAVIEPAPAKMFDVHPLHEYAQTYFNLTLPRVSIFHKPVNIDLKKRLEWENTIISTPLTRLSKDQVEVAIQAFRNVSGFMGNRASGKSQIDHCFKLLRNVVHRSPALKDEIYCQLCKQLTCNPSTNAILNGWLLLNACLVTFPPSPPLTRRLEKFIIAHTRADGNSKFYSEMIAYAQEALVSLACSATQGERKEIPSVAELKALQRHVPNDITVMLADGSSLIMQVSAWTTSQELASLVAHKLGVCHEKAFALFETNKEEQEFIVPDDERVLDLFAEWERTYIDANEVEKKEKSSGSLNSISEKIATQPAIEGYHLVYKAYLWVHVEDETAADVDLYYLQAVQNVLSGNYICDLDVAVELSSYQLYCTFGSISDLALSNLVDDVHRYIPNSLLSASNRVAIAKLVVASYNTLVNSRYVQSVQQARQAYLRLCKHQPFYGLTLYQVRNSHRITNFPLRIILTINDVGVGILGADSDEILQLFPYTNIASWGYSANSFVFKVVSKDLETEYSFKTTQARSCHCDFALMTTWPRTLKLRIVKRKFSVQLMMLTSKVTDYLISKFFGFVMLRHPRSYKVGGIK